jgi:hypothetical protein
MPAGIHMAISETMQNALKREPQVAIMNNLIPQLPAKGIFIPEEISVEAALLDLAKETRASMENGDPQRKYLGNIFKVGQHVTRKYEGITLNIPLHEPNEQLNLMTIITVYGDEVLKDNDCSLTLPYRVPNLDIANAGEITFTYILDENPRFDYSLSPVGV